MTSSCDGLTNWKRPTRSIWLITSTMLSVSRFRSAWATSRAFAARDAWVTSRMTVMTAFGM